MLYSFPSEILSSAYSYDDYRYLMQQLVAEQRTTGTDQSENMVRYTKNNWQIWQQLEAEFDILPETITFFTNSQPAIWVVFVECWCSDVPPNLVIMNKIAQIANSPIKLYCLLRDNYPQLMDNYLTDGGKAIPKMVCLDPNTFEERFVWGPRPAPAQAMVKAYKASENPIPFASFVLQLREWYKQDGGQTLQNELVALSKIADSSLNSTLFR